MTHGSTLIRHSEIQTWVTDRKGMPAMAGGSDRLGRSRPRLVIKFNRSLRPDGMPSVDTGISPVSWKAWLAELDRQQLALRVSSGSETEYELIERKSLN